MEDRYSVINIRESMGEAKAIYGNKDALCSLISMFSCPKNPDVEAFLQHNAIEFTKKSQSVTYLVLDSIKGDLVGYFTLAIKPVSVRLDKISKTMAKKLSRVSVLDVDTMTFNAAAYLIAQLGKNYSLPKEKQIEGVNLLKSAIDTIRDIQYSIGGVVEFLECEDNDFLLDFYTKNHFKKFDTRFVVPETGETYLLHQLLRFI